MRYAIISDIHANFVALEAVDKDVRQLRTDHNEEIKYWFLGDLVGYGPDPVACIEWLKGPAKIGERWVPGNHDEWLCQPTAFSEEANTSLSKHAQLLVEPLNKAAGDWFKKEVGRAIAQESRSLVQEEYPAAGLAALFIHGALEATQRRTTYLQAYSPLAIETTFTLLRQQYQSQPTTILFCGHTHFPMWVKSLKLEKKFLPIAYGRPVAIEPGLHILNPGSVGQPRDGDVRASYLLFDPENKTVEFRRVVYDTNRVVQQLQTEGYMSSLADRLSTADGREELQRYQKIYRRPQWDLEVVTKEEH